MNKYSDSYDDEDDQPQKKSGGSFIINFLLKLSILGLGLALCGVLLAAMALSLAWPNLPELTAMTDYRPRVPLRI